MDDNNIQNVIEVKNIKKTFKVYFDKGHTLKEKILFRNRNRYEEREVLKDISINVKKGEAVGLVGHNGCGKSTLLKLMTKIIYPDSGTISIKGRISSLIELGAGFHPDMSGRENIYTNAAIFGLTKKEIDQRLEKIISFSELEDYIDNPVRTYSSGMYTRLAFSVAINVDADVLLVDEILAVGDAAFQAKCFEKLMEIKSKGTTIVIVSHSLAQIEQICDRSIWIHEGKIQMEGNPSDVHPSYLEYMGTKKKAHEDMVKAKEAKAEGKETVTETKPEKEEKIAQITKAYFTDENGEKLDRIRCGQAVDLHFEYTADTEKVDKNPLIGIMFYRNDKLQCYGTNTARERIHDIPLKENGEICLHIDKMNLVTGSYWVDIAIRSQNMLAYDYKAKATVFHMYSTCDDVGIARLDHSWNFN